MQELSLFSLVLALGYAFRIRIAIDALISSEAGFPSFAKFGGIFEKIIANGCAHTIFT